MKNITTVGMDLAKNVIQVHAVDCTGELVLNKKYTRASVVNFLAQLSPCTVAMEACGGSHHWARTCRDLGHQARIIPSKYVKAYVWGNKNDAVDAAAICEAAQRPHMRFVPIKSEQQQASLLDHSYRENLMGQRTQLINAMRGHCMEFGIIVPKGARYLDSLLERICYEKDLLVPPQAQQTLSNMADQLEDIEYRLRQIHERLEEFSDQSKACQLLLTIPGIGLLSATALAANIGDISAFRSGRHLAAYLGLVPKHEGTGGKVKLGGISKRGNDYLRKLLIHGGRSLCTPQTLQSQNCLELVKRLMKDYHRKSGAEKKKMINKAAVAVANHNARIVWAVLTKEQPYRKDYVSSVVPDRAAAA